MNQYEQIIKEISAFKYFLESMMNDSKNKIYKPYLVTCTIQTYYEYVTKILKKNLRDRSIHSERINYLKSNNIIDEEEFKILDKTRLLRNSFSHDLTYFPDVEEIKSLHPIFSPYTDQHKIGSLVLQEEKEYAYLNIIIKGYCIISNRLSTKVGTALKEILP